VRKVKVSGGAAGRAIHPEEVVPGRERGADCRSEQQGHSPGLTFVPSSDQAFRVGEHLSVSGAPGGGLSRRP
jgi:hypothetical protein